MKELPKLAALIACTGLTLAAAWTVLEVDPERVHATQPCAPLEANDFDRQAANSPLHADFDDATPPALDERGSQVGPTGETGNCESPQEQTPHVNFYKDGDLVNVTGKDKDGTLRLSGQQVIRLTKRVESDKRVGMIEPLDFSEEEKLIKSLKLLVEEIERDSFKEESDFDPKRVPDGYVANLKKDGVWTKYDAKGSRIQETTWLEGKREGVFSTWHPDGGIAQTGAYVNGLQSGRWSTWSAAGQLMCDMTYVDGQLHGAFCSYHSNGVVSSEGTFENNQSIGIWSFYDSTGRETQQVDYSLQPLKDAPAETDKKVVRRVKSRRG